MTFAERTKVPVQQTKSEIERMVVKRGGTAFGVMQDHERTAIFFCVHERNIRFGMPIAFDAPEALKRQRWRALSLVIKAKFESIDCEIETVDEAFLAHIVTPDGDTVGQHVIRPLQTAIANQTVPLLPKF